MAKAREMLSEVVQEYRGTPWADIAAEQLKRTMPLTMTPIFYVQPVVDYRP